MCCRESIHRGLQRRPNITASCAAFWTERHKRVLKRLRGRKFSTQNSQRIGRKFVNGRCFERETRWWETARWVTLWSVGMPDILPPRKLNCFNLARKTYRLLCNSNVELHVKSRGATRMFVDRE